MARALALLSGIDEAELEAAQRASAAAIAAGDSGAGAPGDDGSPTRDASAQGDTSSRNGAPAFESGATLPGDTPARNGASSQNGASTHSSFSSRNGATTRNGSPRRPARPLYTLQEVHERTGIPYATLALYAARHAERIPSLGERRSPAYPREGLEELCRIHAEANPGWEPPPLGAEKGWDDQPGLAARLDALAAVQDRLSAELGQVLRELRRGASTEAVWVD